MADNVGLILQEAEKRPNALSQFLFLDLEETFRRNVLILTCQSSQCCYPNFRKYEKKSLHAMYLLLPIIVMNSG